MGVPGFSVIAYTALSSTTEEITLHQNEAGLSFRRLIGTSMTTKLIVDIGSQIFNPFMSLISAGLGINVVELGRLLGLRTAMGFFAPLSGALSDRFGYRLVIRVALLVIAAGCLLLAVSTRWWMVVVSIMLAGLGTGAFTPNLQAYVSGRLPYSQRARGLGIIEYAWALTGMLGLPLVGLLVSATGWRTPFYLIAAGLVVMSFVFNAMPGIQRQRLAAPAVSIVAASQPARRYWLRRLLSIFIVGTNRRSTYATIIAGTLSYFAAMQLMIMYGAWLSGRYGLDPAALGFVALIIGCFDLAGSVAVSLFTDRIGKKRSVLIGICGSLLAYLAMPFLDIGIMSAVVVIAVSRMCFEFNIVSNFPLLSDQVPEQRGQVMTLGTAINMIGGTMAGFTAPWLYVNVGLTALAWTSAALVTLALLVVVLFVRERDHHESQAD
jgi:predicted MFS family arabinose efflux permease